MRLAAVLPSPMARMTVAAPRTMSPPAKTPGNGAILGGLGLVVSLSPWLMLAGALVGLAVGWFIAWRRWGVFRTCLLFNAVMLPIVCLASFNPFTVLATACTGMVIGWAIQLTWGH